MSLPSMYSGSLIVTSPLSALSINDFSTFDFWLSPLTRLLTYSAELSANLRLLPIPVVFSWRLNAAYATYSCDRVLQTSRIFVMSPFLLVYCSN